MNIILSKSSIFYIIFLLIFSQQLLIANVVINNGLTHIHVVDGDYIIKGKIEIQNTDAEPQVVKVYQKDYTFNHKGEVFYNEPGLAPRSNAKWIDFSPSYFELAPKEESIILYEIKVPEEEILTGSYWSILMVEGQRAASEAPNPKSLTINTIVRYAVQIVTNIGETGERNLEFVKAGLKREQGEKFSEIAIENTGERLLQPMISLELFNDNGENVGVVKAEKKKIYPGTSTKFLLDLAKFPEGEYQAIVLADCNEEDIFGLNLTLKINND